MSDLFGKVLGSIVSKATGGSTQTAGGKNVDGGLLGGLLGGVMGKAGSGLNSLVKRLLAAGLGNAVKSWIGKGPNHLLTADQISAGLGEEKMAELSAKLGISHEEVASLLAKHLPDAVDQMTPDGELVDLTPKN